MEWSLENTLERPVRLNSDNFREEEIEMQVRDLMTKHVETVRGEDSLFDAAQKMRSADAGAIPVTDAGEVVIGILTDRDIVVRAIAEGADPKAIQVRDTMTGDPVTCRPDCPVEAAATTMRDRQIRRLVVTEEHDKKVVGMLSLGDIAARGHERELVGSATEGICQPE
jgi:CBS domain-containing protein